MARRVGDILKQRALESFIGRTEEKTILLSLLEENGPLVVFVHGIGGIGKSSLLEAFSEEARGRKRRKLPILRTAASDSISSFKYTST